MPKIAIIAGTALAHLSQFTLQEEKIMATPFGEPSAAFKIGHLQGVEVVLLARHGVPHRILPHRVNYRANLFALKELGVQSVLAVGAVGGITHSMKAGTLQVPHQAIDYTYNRAHTFFDETGEDFTNHVDFTEPFTERLRQIYLKTAKDLNITVLSHSIVAVVQGPRLETAAEIDKMERDGCDIVNMTIMPEAVLARELSIEYGLLTIVVNRAAGRMDGEITMDDIIKTRDEAAGNINRILVNAAALV